MLDEETRHVTEPVLSSYNVVIRSGSHTLSSACTNAPVVYGELPGRVA